MRRTFVLLAHADKNFTGFSDEIVSEIVDGIQNIGGDIISVGLSPNIGRVGEHLLVFYEDNNKNDSIKLFLNQFRGREFLAFDKRTLTKLY